MRSLSALLLCVLLWAPLARAQVSPAEAKVLTDLITVAVARTQGIEVLSAQDVRNLVELEAGKAAAGCADDSSCLAEVAGALGARLVVFGQLGQLDEQLILTLSVFDAYTARASSREVLRGASVSALSDAIEATAPAMVEQALREGLEAPMAGDDAGERPKVLVMDLAVAQEPIAAAPQEPAAVAAAEPELHMLVLGGGLTSVAGAALMGAGGVAALLGLFAHEEASMPTTPQTVAQQKIEARDGWTTAAYVIVPTGLAVVLSGAALAGIGLALGGE